MLYLFLAEGFEDVEAIATLDVIRRAGIDVKTVGIGGYMIKSSHGVTVRCDVTEEEATFSGLDGIILPGGMPGTKNLKKSKNVNYAIDYCASAGKLIAAICAAPSILGSKNLLNGKNATCYPGFEDELNGAAVSEDYVVADGNIITAKGMGSTVNFGLEIVAYFKGNDVSSKLKETLQCS